MAPGAPRNLTTQGIAYDSSDGNLYTADVTNCAVRRLTTAGTVTTVARGCSNGSPGFDGSLFPDQIAFDQSDGRLYVTGVAVVKSLQF